MGARNVFRRWAEEVINEGAVMPFGVGETLVWSPETNDQGAIHFGNGTNDQDVKIFLGATTDYCEFNVGDGQVNIEGAELHFGDNDALEFGDGNDVTVAWNGAALNVLPATDDTGAVNVGNGTKDIDLKVFLGAVGSYIEFNVGDSETKIIGSDLRLEGSSNSSYLLFDSSNNNLRSFGPMQLDIHNTPKRYGFTWVAGERGKPGINGDIQNASEAVRMIADPYFEVTGTNATSARVKLANNISGIALNTGPSTGDQTILQPHTDANQSGWNAIPWTTSKELKWDCAIWLDFDSDQIAWAGLKLTSTNTVATDANQAYFLVDDGTYGEYFQAVDSIAGVDTVTNTGVLVETDTVYHLAIEFNSSRNARMYIDGSAVRTTGVLPSVNLKPYIGIGNVNDENKDLNVGGQSISKIAL